MTQFKVWVFDQDVVRARRAGFHCHRVISIVDVAVEKVRWATEQNKKSILDAGIGIGIGIDIASNILEKSHLHVVDVDVAGPTPGIDAVCVVWLH